jgi:hypothetical protein
LVLTDLFWEKSTAGWLLMADLFWEKSSAGWWLISQTNRASWNCLLTATGATVYIFIFSKGKNVVLYFHFFKGKNVASTAVIHSMLFGVTIISFLQSLAEVSHTHTTA